MAIVSFEIIDGLKEYAPDSVVIVDMQGEIVLVNAQTEKMFGYSQDELMKKPIEILIPGRFREAHVKHRAGYISSPYTRPMAIGLDITCLRKDGSEFPTDISLGPMETDRGLLIISFIRDISLRREADEKIKTALKEKEILLREIYHRVKNNMQVISSLISLQSQYIEDKKVAEMCRESQNRIRSMALVHEKLYQSKSLANIDFNEYIKDLVDSLFRSYECYAGRIAVRIEAEDVALSLDSAIPCGLIINELVSNSIKYAFPPACSLPRRQAGADRGGERDEDKRCEVCILLSSVGPDTFELTVGNNGIGIPAHLDINNTASLGLKLVNILVNQLHGSLELRREGGTEFRIRFKDIKRKGIKEVG